MADVATEQTSTRDTSGDEAAALDMGAFIDASPSPFHAVAEAARRLAAAGFADVDERSPAEEAPANGYVIRDGSIVAWANITVDAATDGMRIIGAHTDSPNLRVKPRPDLASAGATQLAMEPYGGVLLNSWLGRDLGLSGRVALKDGRMVLVRTDAPVLHLPQLAIHLDREVSTKGLVIDPQKHTSPLFGLLAAGRPRADARDEHRGGPAGNDSPKGDFAAWLAALITSDAEAGDEVFASDIAAWDVMAHDLTPSGIVGADASLFAAPRIDNQASSWAGIEALIAAGRGVVALWDHEEIGSSSNRGAGSPFVESVLERLLPDPALRRRALANGICASSDMAHATHPNFPEKHEPNHPINLGGGPVIKTNVNQRYATDARSAQVFVAACERAGVPLQWYSHRADLPCGSTIGPITAANLGLSVVDVGGPMLAMHSARELTSVADVSMLKLALTAFLEG